MRIYLIAIMALFCVASVSAQTKVGDATLPNTMTMEGTSLTLNGAGLREKLVFDLYAGGLYLTSKSSNASSIINADETMTIKLHILSKLVTNKKMVSAVNDGFEKSLDGNTAAMSNKIEKFKGFFSDKIVKGKNGTEIGVIEGLDFKKALFGIWLGEDPADGDLKEGMLGK